MSSSVALTVGLPVYNGERFLPEALASILGQTYEDFRLVVSDNASTDATEEICRDATQRDSRVVYLRHDTNRGAAWNYNHVLQQGDTPFFRWTAADDIFAPTCFERCAEVMAEAPETVALCYSATVIIDENGDRVDDYDDNLDLRSRSPHLRIRQLVRTIVQGNPMFGLARTHVLRRTRGHGSFPCADYVLLAEIALAGEIWEIPERLFYRRFHGETSRAMNPSPEEYTLWHDPSAKPVRYETARLLREYLAAVRHAPLSPVERAACYASVTATWTRRYAVTRHPVRLLRRALRRPAAK